MSTVLLNFFFQILKNHSKLASHTKIGKGPIWPRAHSFLTLGLECLLMPSVSWGERLWTIGFLKGFDPGLWTWATCSYIPMTLLEIMWILAPRGSSPAAPFLCPGLCQVQHQVPRHIRLRLHFVVSLLGKLGLYKRNTWQLSGALTHCWKRAWGKKHDQEETWRLRDNSNLTGNQALGEAGMNKDLG